MNASCHNHTILVTGHNTTWLQLSVILAIEYSSNRIKKNKMWSFGATKSASIFFCIQIFWGIWEIIAAKMHFVVRLKLRKSNSNITYYTTWLCIQMPDSCNKEGCRMLERKLFPFLCVLTNIGKAVMKHGCWEFVSFPVVNPCVCLWFFRCRRFINQICCYICSAWANEVTPSAETQHWFHFLPFWLLPG